MLTGLQIRAARAALSMSAEQLASLSSVSLRTVQRMELSDGVPSGRISTVLAIRAALENAGIEFIGSPDDRPGIRLKAIMPSGDKL